MSLTFKVWASLKFDWAVKGDYYNYFGQYTRLLKVIRPLATTWSFFPMVSSRWSSFTFP
jgi:hypothetical protein